MTSRSPVDDPELGWVTSRRVEPHIVVIDNHDSFTWNLVQYLEGLGARCTVVLNDAVRALDLHALEPRGVVLSPGPGAPSDAGVTLEAIETLAGRCPLLGICLGFQAIAQHFGAEVRRACTPVHGRTSAITHDGDALFDRIPSPFRAARYHSLAVDTATLPEALVPTAFSDDGELMALRHRHLSIRGVQFHPESILSEHGMVLMRNWLSTL